MMYFSTFSKETQTKSLNFLECPNPKHESYLLDCVCLEEECKENNRLICTLCHYEKHKKHKIQPLEVFINKYKQMLGKENGKNSEALDVCIDHIIHLYGEAFQKLNKLMQDLQGHFSKTLLDLNHIYSSKLEHINTIIREENEILELNSIQNLQFLEADKNIKSLFNKILISDEEFLPRRAKKSPGEISKLISSINNFQNYLKKDLEKNFETFKNSLHLSLSKFTDTVVEEEKSMKNDPPPHIVQKQSYNNNNNNNNENLLQIEIMTRKFQETVGLDYYRRENEMFFRNFQFNNFLEILKQDFSLMVDKLDKIQNSGSEYKKPDHYHTKRDFIAEFETMLLLPKKDFVSWN